MIEEWRSVAGYEGIYEVSNLGNVRSLDRLNGRGFRIKGQNMKPVTNQKGYLRVGLSLNNVQSLKSIHRLVAQAFIPNPDNKPQVNHIDENKQNNHVDNLEWVTNRENALHGTKIARNSANTNYRKKVANTDYSLIGEKQAKPVTATNIKSGEKIKFKSMQEAHRHGFHPSAICRCCKGQLQQYKGFTWEYPDKSA